MKDNIITKLMFFSCCMIFLTVGFVVLSKHISNEPMNTNEIPTVIQPQKDSVITTCPHCGYKVSIECNESNTTYKNN
jgi:predicted RNA-binding Zn-ribbon protein involved in translation (DUF1610 family)